MVRFILGSDQLASVYSLNDHAKFWCQIWFHTLACTYLSVLHIYLARYIHLLSLRCWRGSESKFILANKHSIYSHSYPHNVHLVKSIISHFLIFIWHFAQLFCFLCWHRTKFPPDLLHRKTGPKYTCIQSTYQK